MAIRGVAHIGIPVSDMERSLRFYHGVLGLQIIESGESSSEQISTGVQVPNARIKTTLLDVGNTQLELLQYASPAGRPFNRQNNDVGTTHVNFQVADIRVTYEKLQSFGVPCNTPPIRSGDSPGWGWFYARDPDGIPVEFFGPLEV
jgi:glyoxylase I family protein